MNISSIRKVRVEADSLDAPIFVSVNTAAPRRYNVELQKGLETAEATKDPIVGNDATYAWLNRVVTAVVDDAGDPITVDDKAVLPLGEHVPDFLVSAISNAVKAAIEAKNPNLTRL